MAKVLLHAYDADDNRWYGNLISGNFIEIYRQHLK